MQSSVLAPSIMVIGDNEIQESYKEQWEDYTHYLTFRATKKGIRKQNPALLISCIANEGDEKLAKEVIGFIRKGLMNQDIRIALIHSSTFNLNAINWMEEFGVNVCLIAENKKRSFNISTLNREIDTYIHINNNKTLHEAEIEMLMCITQFSRDNESL